MAKDLNLEGIVRQGVYTMVGGPNYETVAELKMLKELGVDSVGMSTIPETIVAHHCGMAVLAFCLVTNLCAIDPVLHTSAAPNHQAKTIYDLFLFTGYRIFSSIIDY